MEKEFNLSDKIWVANQNDSPLVIAEDDVKEFIKILKEQFKDTKNGGRISILPKEYRELIDQLAGDKLNGN